MHKMEIAKLVSIEMKKINPNIDVKRTMRTLYSGMSKEELTKALNGMRSGRATA